MNTDIVVIAAGFDISDSLEVTFGGETIEPMQILYRRMYAVPYGSDVVIKNNNTTLTFNLKFYMSDDVVIQIPTGSSETFKAVRDVMIRGFYVTDTPEE